MSYNPSTSLSPSFVNQIPSFLTGEDSPRELLERYISVIQARDNEVRAFVDLNLDGARSSADASSKRYAEGKPISPIDGLPIGIKDIIGKGTSKRDAERKAADKFLKFYNDMNEK